MKTKHFEEINRKYKSGDAFRPILKKSIPINYLLEQAPNEQFWFRDKFRKQDSLSDESLEDSRNNIEI